MTQAATVGTLTRFAMDTANPPTHAFEYKQFSLGKNLQVLSTDGIRGTRSHPVERTRAGTYTVDGTIAMEPGPADLDLLLPFILGAVASGTTFALAETLPSFYVAIDRIAAQFLYAGCKVNRATFSAQQGGFLELALEIMGLTEAQGTVTGLSALVPSLAVPYVFQDAALTYGGTAYQFREWQLVVDNHLKPDRFMNSQVRTDLPALDRTVSLSLKTPYTTDQSSTLYDQGVTSAAVVCTFTNSANVVTFTTPAVQFPTVPPETPGREELLLPLRGIARKTGTTAELTVTNTP